VSEGLVEWRGVNGVGRSGYQVHGLPHLLNDLRSLAYCMEWSFAVIKINSFMKNATMPS
jgi:hypothetical protein